MVDPTPRPAPSFDDPNSSTATDGGGASGSGNPIFSTSGTPTFGTGPSYSAASTTYGNANGNTFMTVPHDPTAPKVYFGPQAGAPAMSEHGGGKSPIYYDDIRSFEDAQNDIYSWSARHRRAMGNKMYAMGLIQSPTDYDGMNKVWNSAVKEAAMRFTTSNGKNKITPYDMIDAMAGLGGNGSPYANKTTTMTSTHTKTIDKDTADAAVRSIFQDGVGRDPTKGELSKYSTLLTGYLKGHPDTSTTTTKHDQYGGDVSSNTVEQVGSTDAGIQDNLKQNLKQTNEYGTYQAATTYYNALMRMVAGGG